MITPGAVVTLNDAEKAIAAKMEAVIDNAITSESEVNPEAKTFTILREPMAKEITGEIGAIVTLKVAHHVLNSYRAAGWQVESDASAYVFTAKTKKRGGRKPGSKNKPKAEVPVVVEGAAPAATV